MTSSIFFLECHTISFTCSNLPTEASPGNRYQFFSSVCSRFQWLLWHFSTFLSVLSFQSSSWAAPFGSEHRSGAGGATGALTFLSLSRYLHHRRWVWSVQASLGMTLTNTAVTRILNTLARQRFHHVRNSTQRTILQHLIYTTISFINSFFHKQGFHFAHSHQGIQTMARELTMKTGTGGLSAKSTEQPCLVQVYSLTK